MVGMGQGSLVIGPADAVLEVLLGLRKGRRMPRCIVYRVESESDLGDPKVAGTFSFKLDESFADARRLLENLKYVSFPFDFFDVSLGIRMMGVYEAGNLLEDCGGKITILPKLPRNCEWDSGDGTGFTIGLSSGASNGITTTSTEIEGQEHLHPNENDIDEVSGEPAEEVPCPKSSAPVDDPHANLKSSLMPADVHQAWSAIVDKLKEFMSKSGLADQKWQVRTWDRNGASNAQIYCEECEHGYPSGACKDVVDKFAITNVLTNFKSKHLKCDKHIASVAKNRKLRVDSYEMQKVVEASTVSKRSKLDQAVKMLDRINDSHNWGKATFKVVGDLTQEPVIDLNKFKALCNYCCKVFMLVPAKGTLEVNLETHCLSGEHISAVAKSEKPPSGLPILTGRAGRPRVGDKRDRKQPTIQGFMYSKPESSANNTAHASEPTTSGTLDPKSICCWGLWRESVKWGDVTRPIKGLLWDPPKEDGQWFGAPLVNEKVWCLTSQTLCDISGIFRHRKCSRASELGGGFLDLTCEECDSIRLCDDFRQRLRREHIAAEKRGARGTGMGRRLDYLNLPEIHSQAKAYSSTIYNVRKQCRVLQHRLLMLRMHSPRIGDLCNESANRRDILKFCNSIVLAHKRGAFGGREALWDMLRDIASNLNKEKQGHGFHKGTKLLMQTLFLHGGRRVIDCLATNGIGTSLSTCNVIDET